MQRCWSQMSENLEIWQKLHPRHSQEWVLYQWRMKIHVLFSWCIGTRSLTLWLCHHLPMMSQCNWRHSLRLWKLQGNTTNHLVAAAVAPILLMVQRVATKANPAGETLVLAA